MAIKLFTLHQIAEAYGRPVTTTYNHIIKLKLDGKFKKTSIGSSYILSELKQLEKLLGFTFQ